MKNDRGRKDDPVWEASVALALRDSQWLARPQQMVSPRSYIPLSHVPETRMGDAFFPLSDRYFIFELKGDRTRIPSEWIPKEIGGVVMPAKSAYRSLKRVFSKWLEGKTDDTDPNPPQTIFQSLLGHYFVYWSDEPSEQLPKGNLVVEPYLRAVFSFPEGDGLHEAIDRTFFLGACDAPLIVANDPERIDFVPTIPIQTLNDDRGVLATLDDCGNIRDLGQIGLPRNQFKAYCDFLMGTAKQQHHEIRVVVTNGDGSFARMMTNTSDFSELFSPDPSPRLELKNQGKKPFIGRPRPRR